MYHFGEMYPIRLSEYFRKYSVIDSMPKLWHFVNILPSVFLQGPKSINYFFRFLFANQIPNSDNLLNSEHPPDIVIAVVVASKDFHLLKSCIEFAVKNSINPVEKVFLITPNDEKEKCLEFTKNLNILVPIIIKSEDFLIPEADRNKLRLFFGDKYGWILQQLLKISFAKEQDSSGVLIVDADTVILKPTLWLDQNLKQLLLVSNEFHSPYYIFLKKIGLIKRKPKYTFITHHMLFQKKFLNNILNLVCGGSISKLIDLIISLADNENPSPVCVEYELYGQGMFNFFSESIILSRFCNIPIKYEPGKAIDHSLNTDYTGKYKSISLHSYLN